MPDTHDALDDLLPAADQERVIAAIREAESRTSGEIKVHLDPRCPGEAMARAREVFASQGLQQTRHRNAVLLYLAPRDRKFAVVGDQGIHGRAGDALWARTAAAMRAAFARGALGDGLVAAIAEVGAVLHEQFPPEPGDANEIPDTISGGAGPAPPEHAR